jgi:hypothetical protein
VARFNSYEFVCRLKNSQLTAYLIGVLHMTTQADTTSPTAQATHGAEATASTGTAERKEATIVILIVVLCVA